MSGFSRLSVQEQGALELGALGFKRLTTGVHVAGSGAASDVEEFTAAIAVNAGATYGPACVALKGDIPDSGDAIPQDVTHHFTFSTLDILAGDVFAYFIPKSGAVQD